MLSLQRWPMSRRVSDPRARVNDCYHTFGTIDEMMGCCESAELVFCGTTRTCNGASEWIRIVWCETTQRKEWFAT